MSEKQEQRLMDADTIGLLNDISEKMGKNHVELVERLTRVETMSAAIKEEAQKTNGRVGALEGFRATCASMEDLDTAQKRIDTLEGFKNNLIGLSWIGGILLFLASVSLTYGIARTLDRIEKNTEIVLKLDQIHKLSGELK